MTPFRLLTALASVVGAQTRKYASAFYTQGPKQSTSTPEGSNRPSPVSLGSRFTHSARNLRTLSPLEKKKGCRDRFVRSPFRASRATQSGWEDVGCAVVRTDEVVAILQGAAADAT